MIDPKVLYRDILKETIAYFKQQKQNGFYSFSDPSIFPKEKTKPALEKIITKDIIKNPPRVIPHKETTNTKTAPPELKEECKPSQSTLTVPVIPTSQISETLQKIIPTLKIIWEIPPDNQALAIKARWKLPSSTTILLLTSEKKLEIISFLQNLAKAIENSFAPTGVVQIQKIEKIDFLERCKLVLAVENDILQGKKILPFYKKLPSTKEIFLNNIPVITLQHCTYYIDNPSNKRLLWNELCQKIPLLLSHQS